MNVSPIDIIIFAPLAPIFGVILFWFIQLLLIESEKYLLSQIRNNHESLCRFTNFLGILFQTLCHALGYTVTKSGISSFYISINYGRVSPKKEKKDVFEWMANTFLFLGPFFIPASLLLIYLYFLMDRGFTIMSTNSYTFSENLIAFGTNLYTFSEGFLVFIFNIDLIHPAHLSFIILLFIFGLGTRPSFIGEKKREKVDMLYDLKNIRYKILHKPIYLLLIILITYIFFYLSVLFNLNWYIALFSIIGWLSIIAIISLFVAHLLILLIKITDEIPNTWKFIPYIIFPLSYIFIRFLFLLHPNNSSNFISLFSSIILTVTSVLLLLKYKTNKFKTKINIKSLTKKVEENNDGSKRIIGK